MKFAQFWFKFRSSYRCIFPNFKFCIYGSFYSFTFLFAMLISKSLKLMRSWFLREHLSFKGFKSFNFEENLPVFSPKVFLKIYFMPYFKEKICLFIVTSVSIFYAEYSLRLLTKNKFGCVETRVPIKIF